MAAGTVNGPQTIFTESVSAVTATNTVALGTYREEGGKIYKYFYMEQAAYPGYAVNYTSGGSGYSVTASMVSGELIAGFIQNTTATTATYCWVLQQGLAKCNTAANSVVAGQANLVVLSSGTVGRFTDYQATSALSAALFANIIGKSIGSGTASGVSILCYINV